MQQRPRWKSALKWIGLWLLAQLFGGVAGVMLQLPKGWDSGLSAIIFAGMIVYAIIQRRVNRAVSKPMLIQKKA